ncbi:MAG: glycoside hydrolase family 2 protein [Culturomica sp.]|nr:glycoside hydrolase family 2 protein [Culturomica sp.]
MIAPFNDGWEFKKGNYPSDPVAQAGWAKGWNKVEIPHTWNNQDMQSKHNSFYAGTAYYKKTLFAEAGWKEKQVYLRFEGAGQVADLYVNDKYVGNHRGGYSAFAFDLSGALKFGEENTLLIRVDNASRPDVIPVNHSLFGVYGGIYRPVWLVVTDPVHIAVTDHASPGVYVTQKNVSSKGADISVKVKLENSTRKNSRVVLENILRDGAGKVVAQKKEEITVGPAGIQAFTQTFHLKNPRLWKGLPDPYLYRVVSRITSGGKVLDEVVQPLGIRKFEIRAGDGFYLNGKKYPMYGVTRHQDWWKVGSALKKEHHDADLEMIMDIGATTIRLAHYQQSDYFYSRCDSLGLIVWAEIPFVNQVSGKEWENAKEQLTDLIRQSFNHPSIYVWGLHNEVYTYGGSSDYTAALTSELHELAKQEDPDRYTVSVNGHGHMEHPVNGKSDIQGMNRYFGWYEKDIQDIKPWIEALETNYPDHKFMLTEYGADANIFQQTEHLGESLNWGRPYYPETFQTKTHEYQWSVIAKHPYIIASYLWNTFDFAVPMWNRGGIPARNMKGLVTFDRKIKKDSYFWYKANWSKEPVLYITQRRLKEREKQVTDITVYSNTGVPELTLNGRKLPPPEKGYTDVHFIFRSVQLDQGANVLKAVAVKNGKTSEDQVEWNFTREHKAGEATELNSSREHGGF